MYLDGSTSLWKDLFEYFVGKENLGIFLRAKFDVKELPNSLPPYYVDSLMSWSEIRVY